MSSSLSVPRVYPKCSLAIDSFGQCCKSFKSKFAYWVLWILCQLLSAVRSAKNDCFDEDGQLWVRVYESKRCRYRYIQRINSSPQIRNVLTKRWKSPIALWGHMLHKGLQTGLYCVMYPGLNKFSECCSDEFADKIEYRKPIKHFQNCFPVYCLHQRGLWSGHWLCF